MKHAIGKSVNLLQLWRPHLGASRLPTLASRKNRIDNVRKKKLLGISQALITHFNFLIFEKKISFEF